jgi:hypothetical protein
MKIRTLVLTLCLAVLSIGSVRAQDVTPQQKADADKRAAEAKRAADQTAVTRAVAEKVAADRAAADAAKVAAAPRKQYQSVNLKIEFTLTDQRAGSAPIKRTVNVIVADGGGGQIRSQSEVIAVGTVPLNIDVNPEILADGKIRLIFSLQYDWPAPFETGDKGPARGTVSKTSMHDSVTLILESGKPMIAAQSADPIGDRQVSVEVKATVAIAVVSRASRMRSGDRAGSSMAATGTRNVCSS